MTRAEIVEMFVCHGMDVQSYPLWALIDRLDLAMTNYRQENKALWDMVDEFNAAVNRAAARLP